MKGFLSVLRFELTNYFKNKGYLITTGIIAAVLIVGLSLPSFFDMVSLNQLLKLLQLFLLL